LDTARTDITIIDNTKETVIFQPVLTDQPVDVAISSDGKTAWAAERSFGFVQSVDTATGGIGLNRKYWIIRWIVKELLMRVARRSLVIAGVFAAVVVTMVVYGVIHCFKALGNPKSTTHEIGIGGALAGAGDD
jgi:hypothetical protein